jgi:chemotaxis protein methyltransferase CheR
MAPAGPSTGPETFALPGQFIITDREFQRFRALIYQHTGIALGETKRQLVCSRLGKRLRHCGYQTFSQYYTHLTERDPKGEELLRMINAITTNKTDFFREADHFAFLSSELLGPLGARAQVGGSRRLRIWSAGCSSGEEPYSIAVTVLEALPNPRAWDVRILASDIDTDVLAQATEGVYRVDRVATVPPEMLKRYFLRGRGDRAGLVRVRKEVSDLVAFRRINLQDEPWPIQTVFDAIFCRNVLIYFDRPGQERLITRLEQRLRPGGFLFLGHSESLIGMQVGLRHIAKTIYQKAAESDRRAMVAHG